MADLVTSPPRAVPPGQDMPGQAEPTWEVAFVYPRRGDWTEEDYLLLPTNHLVELSNGCLEVLPMPTPRHQTTVVFLLRQLLEFVEPRGLGEALVAPMPVRLWSGKFREPDVIFMRSGNAVRIERECWNGADLVMEVISPNDPARDLEIKRQEYAEAGIPEYWIVDPERGVITVLRLQDKKYTLHGEYRSGQQAESALLPGFRVDVGKVFAAR